MNFTVNESNVSLLAHASGSTESTRQNVVVSWESFTTEVMSITGKQLRKFTNTYMMKTKCMLSYQSILDSPGVIEYSGPIYVNDFNVLRLDIYF